jgi:lysozyme
MRKPARIALRLGAGIVSLVVLVGVVVLLGRGGSPASPPPPTVRLAGVDVSSHNHPIPWGAAADSGVRFVIARATEGASRVDERYASVKEQARAAGLAFTAFHFARPDPTRDDALREADAFLEAAGLGPGDLVPVLDLEEAGRLGVRALQAWATIWLDVVGATLGVRPLIYTNANFWRVHMGDTTAFAEAGYRLYIASWGAASPVVPAANWGGRGWALWQTSSCGKVRGIPGCLDTDLYNGADLRPVTIP